MSKIIKFLSLFAVLVNVCVAQGAVRSIVPDCVTPDNKLGSCVDVRYCVTIMTALINGDHQTNPEVGKFLRESQCGIEADSQKVCCHTYSIDFGESPTINTNPTTVVSVTQTPTPTTIVPPIQSQPTTSPPVHNQQQSVPSVDFEKCGKLGVDEKPFVWIAELWYKNNKTGRTIYESKCIGTVITLKHVIVPAHCVASLPIHISLDHLTVENEDYLIGKIFVHASYNQPKFANDIAILELDVELSQSHNYKARAPQQIVNSICLNTSSLQSHIITFTKSEQNPLKAVQISLIPNNQCTMLFEHQPTELTSSQFCANIQSNETDNSPFIGAIIMTYDVVRQQYSLKGFTSTVVRTEQSFDEKRPFIFTDVEQYWNWIRAILSLSEPHSTQNQNESNESAKIDRRILKDLKECQLSDGKGRCVIEDYCLLYQLENTQHLSLQQLELLKSIKCSTGSNQYQENGVCCPENYLNQTALEIIDFNVRVSEDDGLSLLDMEQCGQVDAARRIVGGKKADLKEFPWFALIKHRVGQLDRSMCGGSLISSRYVLTCAHCITQTEYNVVGVRLGEYDLTTNPDCIFKNDDSEECNPPFLDVDIDELLPHPLYNSPRYSNDIGLVRMKRDVEFRRGSIIPICLPINNGMLQTLSNRSTVAGFGFTEHGRDSDVLLKIVVPKVPRETCQSFHRTSIQLSEGHSCYGGEGIVDSCKGDSGSPLLNYAVIDGKLRAIQMGIVASGHSECGRGITGFPGIYTDVTKYINWMIQNMYA